MRLTLLALVLAVVAGVPEGEAQRGRVLLGVFRATLPCVDCASHRLELTLYLRAPNDFGGATFELREIFAFVVDRDGASGGERVVDSSGKWALVRGTAGDPGATVYRINPDKPSQARSFLVVNEDELRELDSLNAELPPERVLTLRRVLDVDPSKVGRYRETAADAPDVRAAAEFAVLAQSVRTGQTLALDRVVSARRQVAAGLNFRLCLSVKTMGEAGPALAVVYQDLNGHFALSYWAAGECS